MAARKIRVIQWATGNTGQRALREVIHDPKFELAGVLVFDDKKNGVDAGVLCDEGPVGVKATTDRTSVLKVDADCVVYTPRAGGRGESRTGLSSQELVDDIVALTSAGKSIVSTCPDLFCRGARFDEKDRARIVAACKQGGASIFASGSSPGIFTETIPLPFLSYSRRVDHIDMEEFGDLSRRPSPHMVMEQMRFGKPIAGWDPERRRKHLYNDYQPPLADLAEMARLEIDEWTSEGGAAGAKHDTEIVAGLIKAGTAAAQRVVIIGRSKGVERLCFTQYMYVSRDVEPDWNLQPTGWRLRIQGDAPVHTDYPFPVKAKELHKFVPAYNANVFVNAIPYVIAARPGFVTSEDLPSMLARGPRTPD